MPEKTLEMSRRLNAILTEMKASYPYFNPDYKRPIPGKENVCTIISHKRHGRNVEFTFKENGAKVVHADLIYTLNGGDRYEEWFRAPAKVLSDSKVSAELPEGTTHYVINLIDENQFLRSYPEMPDENTLNKMKAKYSASALEAGK